VAHHVIFAHAQASESCHTRNHNGMPGFNAVRVRQVGELYRRVGAASGEACIAVV
jgi:hypothetical protein